MGKGCNHNSTEENRFPFTRKCPFCGKKEEELEHILIHCLLICGQWTNLLSTFGVSWVYPKMVKDLLFNWLHFLARKRAKTLWRAVPLILFWAIWKERNRIIFENATFSTFRLKFSFIRSLFARAGCIPNTDISFVRLMLYRFYGCA